IARRFNTTVETLRDVNQIRGSLIRQGESLLIPTSSNNANFYALSAEERLKRIQSRGKDGKEEIRYKVKRGDSFWEISRRYKVSVGQLAKWNGMAPADPLRVGQELVIWSDDAPVSTAANLDRGGRLIRELAYRVRRGDSLAAIANKFNISVQDIASWNSLEASDYIHPGQRLKLIVDITNTR